MDSLYAAAEKKQHMTRECERQESGGGGNLQRFCAKHEVTASVGRRHSRQHWP